MVCRGSLLPEDDRRCRACAYWARRCSSLCNVLRTEWEERLVSPHRHYPPTSATVVTGDPSLDPVVYNMPVAYHRCALSRAPPFERPYLTRLSLPRPAPTSPLTCLRFAVWLHVLVPVEMPRIRWRMVSRLHFSICLPRMFPSWDEDNACYLSGTLTLEGEQWGRKKKLGVSWTPNSRWDRMGLPPAFFLLPWEWRPAIVYAPRFDGQVAAAGVELLSIS